ncbi:signal peptidase I [Streptomyces sp. NPDC059985]|uniref:signal peptidase I n=1 Tax=Streptomyces sp. NPDC059985 TaxID=3347025 RepID=UPI0036C15283
MEQQRAPHDGDEGGRAPGPASRVSRRWRAVRELLLGAAAVLVLGAVLRLFVAQVFSIPSGSMEQTLKIGDRVAVEKVSEVLGKNPSRGQVVVFQDPGGWLPPADDRGGSALGDFLRWFGLLPDARGELIKRVIGVEGDTVSCQGSGPVRVNDAALSEPYIFPGNTPCGGVPFGPVKVPPGRLWVMGDHRSDSLDSRFHQAGPGKGTIPVSTVTGPAVAVIWPFTHWKTLPIPETFRQPGVSRRSGG